MMKGFEGRHRRIHPLAAIIIALFAAGLVFAGYSIIHGLLQTRSETHQEALADCRSAQQRFSTTYTTYRATMSSAQRLAETGESDVANPASVSDLARHHRTDAEGHPARTRCRIVRAMRRCPTPI